MVQGVDESWWQIQELVKQIAMLRKLLSDVLNDPGHDIWSFIGTLLATVVGVLIGAGFSSLSRRADQRERYKLAVDQAAARVMSALNAQADSLRDYFDRYTSWAASGDILKKPKGTAPELPNRGELDVLLETLSMATSKSDQHVALAIRESVYELAFVSDWRWVAIEYSSIRRVIWAWRSGKRTDIQTLANLDIIDNRRRMKVDGVADDKLPASPESFESRIPTP